MNSVLFSELLSGSLRDLLRSFISGLPNFFMALVLIIIGIIVSKLVAKVVKTALEKIKIDKLGEKLNEIELVEKSNMKIKISALSSKIIYYILLLLFSVAATDVLGMPALSNMVSDLITFIPNLVVALIWLVLGLLIAEALKNIVQTALTSLGIPSARLISTALFYFLLINVVISALSQAKIDTGFLSQNISLVIGGVVLAFAIGYGLASKDIVSNFLGSVYSKGRFTIGDTITVDGKKGEIVEMDRSSVVIKTEASRIVVPLSKLTKESLEIHS
jgi:hypothetical protein